MPKINVNGLDLWYENSGDGYVVIFLHAFALTSAMWFPQVAELSKTDFQVVCVDLRGHGLSSAPPGPYTIPQLAKDVHELIQHLASGKVALVGLSTGGRVATRVALDFPEDISKLVLVSTKSEPAVEIKVELEKLSKIALNDSEATAAKQFYLNHYQRLANVAPGLMKTLEEVWFDKPGNGFAGVATAISTMESVTKRIAEIQVPTLAVVGELDAACHPYMAWYERSMASCKGFIAPESGHFVNVERSELFNQLLLDFL